MFGKVSNERGWVFKENPSFWKISPITKPKYQQVSSSLFLPRHAFLFVSFFFFFFLLTSQCQRSGSRDTPGLPRIDLTPSGNRKDHPELVTKYGQLLEAPVAACAGKLRPGGPGRLLDISSPTFLQKNWCMSGGPPKTHLWVFWGSKADRKDAPHQ